jgi:hypothetical protein
MISSQALSFCLSDLSMQPSATIIAAIVADATLRSLEPAEIYDRQAVGNDLSPRFPPLRSKALGRRHAHHGRHAHHEGVSRFGRALVLHLGHNRASQAVGTPMDLWI